MFNSKETTAEISIADYIKDYVDVDKFIKYCEKCPNFGSKWSCAPYDFNPEDFWKRYKNLKVIGVQIFFDEQSLEKTYSDYELNKILLGCIKEVRNTLDERFLAMESSRKGRKALYAGACLLCEKCEKPLGKDCRYPEKMRYSIESLGGNVEKTTEELLGIKLVWPAKGRLPEYLCLVGGILS